MNPNSRDNVPCVWTPRLEVMSNAIVEQELYLPKVIVYSNGTMHMFRLGLIRVTTSFETSNYPYDVQTVQLVLTTMSYTKDLVDLTLIGSGIEMEHNFF